MSPQRDLCSSPAEELPLDSCDPSSPTMSRQAPTVRSVLGRRGFSSASEICGRSYAAACQPARCAAGAYSSRSVCNLGGSRRISYVNGVCGNGCFGDFGFGGVVGYGNTGGRVGLCGPRGYSIVRGYPDRKGEGIQGICIDERLLKPLCVGVDPLEHEIRCQEKEQIKTLNTQFACFIDKVSTNCFLLAPGGGKSKNKPSPELQSCSGHALLSWVHARAHILQSEVFSVGECLSVGA